MNTECPEIVLATFNARYIHTAFGLRSLLANMGSLRSRTVIVEFDLKTSPSEAAERLLTLVPQIVGLSVYIWNAGLSLELVRLLKTLRPGLKIVLGGPEVSHEFDRQEICALADHIVLNEGDLAFADLCQALLSGESRPKVINGGAPPLSMIRPAYQEYTATDIKNRILYVEASRGCPFRCEFCLSSLDVPVRQAIPDVFLGQLKDLLTRGARQFKFVDRTFNLDLKFARAILDFFLEHWQPGLFLHFEMVPDRLPEVLREAIRRFPPGALQFEVGIQTFNPEVAERIHRRQNHDRTEENLRWLRAETGVHVHADLIAGLPGESLDSFAAGFDRLFALRPQEIQVGILKKLRGTPIARHIEPFGMVFNPSPPYDLLESRDLNYQTMRRLNRFSAYWDRVSNSGRFARTLTLLFDRATSPFEVFWNLTERFYARFHRIHSISTDNLAEALHEYLLEERTIPAEILSEALLGDLRAAGRRDTPGYLRAFNHSEGETEISSVKRVQTSGPLNVRQFRHLTAQTARAH